MRVLHDQTQKGTVLFCILTSNGGMQKFGYRFNSAFPMATGLTQRSPWLPV